MTMTGSPMSRNGVYFGFLLPLSTLAASVARRPRVLPLASTMNHLRSISCALGMYVDISLYLQQKLAFKTQYAHAKQQRGLKSYPRRKLHVRVRLAQPQPIGVFRVRRPVNLRCGHRHTDGQTRNCARILEYGIFKAESTKCGVFSRFRRPSK